MRLERGCGVSEVPAPDRSDDRRHEPEEPLGAHLKLMVDACGIALGSEAEAVADPERLDVGDDAYLRRTVELLKLLHDVAEAAQFPFESGAVPGRAVIEPPRCP